MKKLIPFLYSLIIISKISFAQPTNINISLTSTFEGEPYLAVNPINPQNIVVAWMADDISTNFRVSIRSKASFDGGVTWGNSFVQPHFGTSWSSADVSMQFRNNGDLYISYIDSHKSPDSGNVYISHSFDGGISWSAPTIAINGLQDDPTKMPVDRPWLAIDNSATANAGMLYITSKPPYWIAPPNRPYLKTSIDNGQTWTPYRYIDTVNHLVGNLIDQPMAAPTVTVDGALCAAYPSYLASQSVYPKIIFAKSYNRGSSFTYHDLLVNPVGLPNTDTLSKAGYHLAANPNNSNQLAFAALDNRNGDPDVYIATTNDGGLTWNTGVRVNDDPIGNGVSQDMVWASYEANGKLLVVWRDRRNGTGSGYAQSTDTYCAVSVDNGATFLPNIRLSGATAAYNAILNQKGNDFLSCQLMNDSIYAAWGDVRNGHLNIYFAKYSINTGSSVGVFSITSDNEQVINLYPNPTSSRLFLDFKNNSITQATLNIYNANGQLVFSKLIINTIQNTSLVLPSLPDGIYFAEAIANQKLLLKSQLLISGNTK